MPFKKIFGRIFKIALWLVGGYAAIIVICIAVVLILNLTPIWNILPEGAKKAVAGFAGSKRLEQEQYAASLAEATPESQKKIREELFDPKLGQNEKQELVEKLACQQLRVDEPMVMENIEALWRLFGDESASDNLRITILNRLVANGVFSRTGVESVLKYAGSKDNEKIKELGKDSPEYQAINAAYGYLFLAAKVDYGADVIIEILKDQSSPFSNRTILTLILEYTAKGEFQREKILNAFLFILQNDKDAEFRKFVSSAFANPELVDPKADAAILKKVIDLKNSGAF